MKLKPRTSTVPNNTYMCEATIFVNCSYEQMKRKLAKRINGNVDYLPDQNRSGEHLVIENDKTKQISRIIWIKKFDPKNYDDIGALSHELLHYVLRVFEDRGILISEKNSEAMAYFYEHTMRSALRELSR